MNIKDPLFKKTLKEIAKEKGLTEQQLKSFLAKVALVESGTNLDHTVKQIGGGPGRGIGQWETNEGKGSNRVVTSLGRANNYFKDKGQKTPEFIKKALEEVKETGTYDMTNLDKEQQMLVLLSDFRMGNGDLADLKDGNEFEMWKDHWWQGNEEDVPEKRKLWEEKNNYFEENKDKVFTKLYDESSSQLQQSNETHIPFKNNTSQNYNVAQDVKQHIDNSKRSLNDYIQESNQNQKSRIAQHIDNSKALVNDYLNNNKFSLGGLTNNCGGPGEPPCNEEYYKKIRNSREGVRKNSDGTVSSHLMASSDNHAYPTLFQKEDGSWYQLPDGKEGNWQAKKEAIKRNEFYTFDSPEEAYNFSSKGLWKNNTKALGGMVSAGTKIKSKNLNSFNTGGLHEQNRLGGIPQGKGSNGKMNTVEENETSFNTSKGKFIFSDRIGLTDYINKSLKKKSNNQFAEGGNIEKPNPFPFLPNEKPIVGPKRPTKEEKVVNSINKKETTIPSNKKRDVSNLNKLFFDFSKEEEKVGKFRNPLDIIEGKNPNKYSEIDDRFSEIHKESNKSCLAGSLNCSQEFIAKNSGLPGLRTIISNSNADPSKYKIPSRDKTGRIIDSDYIPNQSIDAWEVHDFLIGEGLGENLFTKDKNTKYEKNSYLPKGFDYKNIPLGAVIGQGNSAGVYTDPKDGERSRHALTVVGFDKKDDMPMVYDYGKLTRLDDLNALSGKNFKINRITVPNEYKGMTADKIRKDINKEEKRLGYSDRKPLSFNSNKPHLKAIEEGINEVATQIGYNYEIPNRTINKFSRLLPGLSNQETKINNNEGISKSIIADNIYGNNVGKPILKTYESIWNNATNFFKKEGEKKQDYQLEIEAYKKYPNDSKKFKQYFHILKEKNEEIKNNKGQFEGNTNSSVGPFATKDITDYAVKELGIEKSDLYGIRSSNSEELKKGSQVALSYLAENYNKFKEKYPELSEDELVDLTIVSYNNKAKTEDPEFIKYYIKNKKLKDNYLEKIKSYKIK